MKFLFICLFLVVVTLFFARDNLEPGPTSNCDRFTLHQKGIASWYGDYFHGRIMSNRKPFDMNAYTVAHRKLPLGTKICISNPKNNRAVIAIVTDRGPYVKPRVIDLSKKIAEYLKIGLDPVRIYKM